MTKGWIRAVLLILFPELERQSFQWRGGVVLGDVEVLGLSMQFGKIVIFALRARPVGRENTGVCPCWLSIKPDGEGEDVDKNVGVEEAVHPQSASEQCGLGA